MDLLITPSDRPGYFVVTDDGRRIATLWYSEGSTSAALELIVGDRTVEAPFYGIADASDMAELVARVFDPVAIDVEVIAFERLVAEERALMNERGETPDATRRRDLDMPGGLIWQKRAERQRQAGVLEAKIVRMTGVSLQELRRLGLN